MRIRAPRVFRTPSYSGDFPDPSLLYAGGTYWAYATGSAGRNLQVMASPDLHTWSSPVDPLPVLPPWASRGLTWAPGVMEAGRQYVMHYTVRHASLGVQCISVATSPAPGGPFTDGSAQPLVCQTARGGSIDPNPYHDPVSGDLVLVWKSDDNARGQKTHIWGQRLTATGLAFAEGSSPALLLSESAPWHVPRMEGPTLHRHGSLWYLFYGANDYNTARSGIGYATASNPLGTYTDRSQSRPWLATTRHARGPQGPMVFEDAAGSARMAFAAWYGPVGYEHGGSRSLWIGTLGFDPSGTPGLS